MWSGWGSVYPHIPGKAWDPQTVATATGRKVFSVPLGLERRTLGHWGLPVDAACLRSGTPDPAPLQPCALGLWSHVSERILSLLKGVRAAFSYNHHQQERDPRAALEARRKKDAAPASSRVLSRPPLPRASSGAVLCAPEPL